MDLDQAPWHRVTGDVSRGRLLMGSSAWLATQVDEFMLSGKIASASEPLDKLPAKTGAQVADEIGGRMLFRYVPINQVHEPQDGRAGVVTFVTPTPYAPEDLNHYLDLPAPQLLRTHVIRLNPSALAEIRGPQWVGLGMGIQYVLPDGYDSSAVVPPTWGHEIR